MTVSWSTVDSSNIDMIGYDDEAEELHVRFNSGSEYVYHQVPPAVHEEFLDADSKGKFLSERIKGQYEYKKV